MSRQAGSFVNFSGGIVSPLFAGRTDLPQYINSLAECDNWIPLPGGAITRRPGTKYVGNCELYSGLESWMAYVDNVLLFPYVDPQGDEFIIIYGRGYITVRNCNVPGPIAHIFSPGYLATGDEDWVQIGEKIIIVSQSHQPMQIDLSDLGTPSVDPFMIECIPWERYRKYKEGDYVFWFDGANNQFCTALRDLTADESLLDPDDSSLTCWSLSTSENASLYNPFMTPDDWPGKVDVHEGRIIFGSTANNPYTLWGSSSEKITYLMGLTSTNAADPWSYQLKAYYGPIQWIKGGDLLFVGTTLFEIRVSGGSLGITAQTVLVRPQTNFGSVAVKPEKIGSNLFFWESRRLRSYFWQDQNAAYQSFDLTAFVPNLFHDGSAVAGFAFMSKPYPILWAYKENGKLIGCTMDQQSQTYAWHTHTLGGLYSEVVAMAGVRMNRFNDSDRVYIVVKRDSGQVDEYSNPIFNFSLEYLEGPDFSKTALEENFLDMAMPIPQMEPPCNITGSPYIPEPLDVVVDTFHLGQVTPDANGDFPLPVEEGESVVYGGWTGYHYDSRFITQPLGAGFTKKRVSHLYANLLNSSDISVCTDMVNFDWQTSVLTDGFFDETDQVVLFSGWCEFAALGDWKNEIKLAFKSGVANNATILQIEYFIEENL
jgi:hypothetical protein